MKNDVLEKVIKLVESAIKDASKYEQCNPKKALIILSQGMVAISGMCRGAILMENEHKKM